MLYNHYQPEQAKDIIQITIKFGQISVKKNIAKPPILGLYETHLFVENLEKSIDFYANTLGLEQCHLNDDRKLAFFWIGKPRQSFLGLWERPKEEIDIRHFAFECSPEYVVNEAIPFLESKGLAYYNFLRDATRQPMVFAWVPAVAIYFKDPDGHELEFIGKLDGPPNPALGVLSYQDWLEHV